MAPSILPSLPEDSVLTRWAAKGLQRELTHSNIVYFGSPDERFVLVVQVDDPVQGYLVELHLEASDEDDASPLRRTIVESVRRSAATISAARAAVTGEPLRESILRNAGGVNQHLVVLLVK